jgi:predicted amidohydrolase
VERLHRAANHIAESVAAETEFVVLPEMFNTGYEYHERNSDLAESLDGKTITWMKTLAARYLIHLAGSLLFRDLSEVYNAGFLVTPDGRH